MASSLASTLYAAFRSAQSDPTALPAWGNLPSDERAAWERVAEVARVAVTEANANKLGNAVMAGIGPDAGDEVVGIAWAAQHLRGRV